MNKKAVKTYLDDITNGIQEFIDSKDYHYSIFLNGEWGIGKTYFVKNTLKKHLRDDVRFIYVSLFGVSSITELDERVANELLIQVVDRKKHLQTKIGKLSLMLGKTTTNYVLRKMALTPEDFPSKSKWKDFLLINQNKKYLFIFDDIERSSCNMKELLGYINTFVEQNKAKVLLIGYDTKIGFTGDINKSKPGKRSNDSTNPSSASSESENDLFSDYQEKLIGYKIDFNPDLITVANSIINSMAKELKIEKRIGVTPKDISDLIISIFIDSKERNLRTLQNVVGTVGRLFRAITDPMYAELFTVKEYKKQFFMHSICDVCYTKLSKGPSQTWIDNQVYWNPMWGLYRPVYLEEFVSSSVMPQSKFKIAIETFIKKNEWEKNNAEDPLTRLRDEYHIIESYEAMKSLYIELIANLKAGKYLPEKWGEILVLISKLEYEKLVDENSFSSVITIIDSLIPSIDWTDKKNDISFYSSATLNFDSKVSQEVKETINAKMEEWDNHKKTSSRIELGNTLRALISQRKMKELIIFLRESYTDLVQGKHYLSLLEWSDIESFLRIATAFEYQEFRSATFFMYEHAGLMNIAEKQFIRNIIEWCEKNVDDGDRIVILQRRWLKDNLSDLIRDKNS